VFSTPANFGSKFEVASVNGCRNK